MNCSSQRPWFYNTATKRTLLPQKSQKIPELLSLGLWTPASISPALPLILTPTGLSPHHSFFQDWSLSHLKHSLFLVLKMSDGWTVWHCSLLAIVPSYVFVDGWLSQRPWVCGSDWCWLPLWGPQSCEDATTSLGAAGSCGATSTPVCLDSGPRAAVHMVWNLG